MTVSLAWRNAVALTNAQEYEYDYKAGFDKRLQLGLVARFQTDHRKELLPNPSNSQTIRFFQERSTTSGRLLNAFEEHMRDDCKSGFLRYEFAPEKKADEYYSWLIESSDFAAWLATNRIQPSVHIQAWFDETGITFGKAKPVEEKPLATRERNTLLAIIAALCKEAKIDYTKPAKAAGQILHTTDSMGLQIGETTIERHLKKIPDALGTRMK
jgi:hypothetical protein